MKTITKTLVEVDSFDLDESVSEFLRGKGMLKEPDPDVAIYMQSNVRYECVAEQEWNNDSSYSFTVVPLKPEDYDMDQIKKGDFSWQLSTILNWMCLEKHIETGEYLVSVSW